MSHSIKRGTCQSRRNKTQTKERRPPPIRAGDIYKVTSRSWCIAKVTSQAASSTRMSKILTSLRVLITMVTELDHHGNGAQAFCLAVNVSVETERTNHLGRMRHTARAGSWRVEVTNKAIRYHLKSLRLKSSPQIGMKISRPLNATVSKEVAP